MPLAALVFLALTAYAIGYSVLCFFSPFGACRRCEGTGNHISWWDRRRAANGTSSKPKRRSIRKPCRRCKGTGARLRIGRRIHNHARRLHADGTR
ncbi:hypothetical protein OG948_19205 [Embleya sp. NBC_00888]|uniref:hypothetical protein n=1 Tax=Embleya sp. NBC_00888 TaxID=2975960 RepID=UPI00386FA3B4|nr:hypothetical protein OG948_19205 [Embleya sp. NBC_00888]